MAVPENFWGKCLEETIDERKVTALSATLKLSSWQSVFLSCYEMSQKAFRRQRVLLLNYLPTNAWGKHKNLHSIKSKDDFFFCPLPSLLLVFQKIALCSSGRSFHYAIKLVGNFAGHRWDVWAGHTHSGVVFKGPTLLYGVVKLNSFPWSGKCFIAFHTERCLSHLVFK